MSERFVNVDRDTPMLLPPSLQDWLPEGHLAHFVVETVTLLPLHGFQVNTRGTGYFSEAAVAAVASDSGPTAYVAVEKTGHHRIRRRRTALF